MASTSFTTQAVPSGVAPGSFGAGEAPTPATTAPPAVPAETLNVVRPHVRDILSRSEGFRRLSPDEQRDLAQTMVKVSAYMADPDGLASEELSKPPGQRLARAQADKKQVSGVEGVKQRLAKAPGSTGEDFEAGAVREGVEQFGQLVQKVDFPKFVGGLIENVFQAIVESSIDQMRAYGELLANVSKSVDEFARDNISANNARDWMAEKYPDAVEVNEQGFADAFADGDTDGTDGFDDSAEASGPQPRLQLKEDMPDGALQEIIDSLGLESEPDLSNAASEAELVRRAQLEIARGRQQLLSSMVMLGINRIVVTDGLIHAKVVFDMRARDTQTREARASLYDRQSSKSRAGVRARYGGWFSPVKASAYADTQKEHMTTVQSSVDDTSESRAEVKARLSGEVRVNFKSDYFPMEKLASETMIAAIQGNAEPPERPVEGA